MSKATILTPVPNGALAVPHQPVPSQPAPGKPAPHQPEPDQQAPSQPQRHVEQVEAALLVVARSITQVRVHERLLRVAGVRLDRAGAALLHKLYVEGDSLRVTDLAELLGVDTPTVTRKVQQLERDEMVDRQTDPDDRRATRIRLTPTGRRTLQRVLRARRAWLERLFEGWDDGDLAMFATLFGRFSADLERDLEDARV
jgi:DNA-binding MarR family transcriptional regulator